MASKPIAQSIAARERPRAIDDPAVFHRYRETWRLTGSETKGEHGSRIAEYLFGNVRLDVSGGHHGARSLSDTPRGTGIAFRNGGDNLREGRRVELGAAHRFGHGHAEHLRGVHGIENIQWQRS